MTTALPSYERARAIAEKCSDASSFHLKKSDRARTQKANSHHWKLYLFYKAFAYRGHNLAQSLFSTERRQQKKHWDNVFVKDDWKARPAIKAERKAKFDSTYRVSLWFMQNSFGADYGIYVCDRCSRTFYHSPARVYLGKELKYDCTCGHCTNLLTGKNVFE